jgi:Fe(3+) dicitrate transport protein
MVNTKETRKDVFRMTPLSFAVAIALCAGYPAIVFSQQTEDRQLPRIDVVSGEESNIEKIPGSVAVISREDLQKSRPLSTEAALRVVPGVVIKPEEETAVVANIGLRGLSAADNKLLVLEDGVPVSPGAFTGNGRYYNPRIQRMEGIEVLKGASSLRYGPNTIGGVINYKTKQPEDGVAVTGQAGSFGYQEYMLEAGGKAMDGRAIGGINAVTSSSNGFMGKGFEMRDVMLKGGMALNEDHWLSAKYTHYQNDANISYRGLLLDAYNSRARYNPAPDDYFLTARDSLDLNHEWAIAPKTQLNTLVYWSQMSRDYWRFDLVSGTPTSGGRWNYSNTVKGNNRDFERRGIDSRLKFNHESFGIQNEAEIGVRIADETMRSEVVTATRAAPRTGTVGSKAFQKAVNSALFAENKFLVNERLSISPGIRVEHYTLERTETGGSGASSNTEVMPGLGSTYRITPENQLFGGIYKAFAPPQIADAIDKFGSDQQLEAERSTNYEIGLRGKRDTLQYEIAAFMMDFSNQVVASNSGGFITANGGKTLHQGVEAGVKYALGDGWDVNANFTYIPVAKFDSGTYAGKRVTYTPEIVSNFIIGYKKEKLSSSLIFSYVGSQYTDQANTEAITESTTGFFTGKTAAYTVVDLTANYALDKNLMLFGSIKNLADTHYIASLRQGIYVGTARSLFAGVRYKF